MGWNMFNQTKYTTWYYRIINRANLRDATGLPYYERHHIIPKCLGGSNAKNNIAKLTAREHYVCHILLTKMFDSGAYKAKMVFALMRMRNTSRYHKREYLNSKNFSYVKEIISKNMSGKNNPSYGKGLFGKDNPFYGKTHSKEVIEAIRENSRKHSAGSNNPFYGKQHTNETCQRLSQLKSIPIKVLFFDGTVITFSNRLELGKYLGKSVHLGAKLLKPAFKHLWKNYCIQDIETI